MPRIKLAYWHGGSAPGDEIDVTGDELAALQRDGRVAEVVNYHSGDSLDPVPAESTSDSGEAEVIEAAPAAGRKRR